jgi:signal transduction histidine kinase
MSVVAQRRMRPATGTPSLSDVVEWFERHRMWVDPLWSVALAVALVGLTGLGFRDEGIDPIAYPCCAVAGLAFAVRRSLPVLTFALVAAAITVYGATGQPGGPIFATAFLAAFNLAAYRGIRTWLPWNLAATVALVTTQWVVDGFSLHLVPVAVLLAMTPKLADDMVRTRRLRMEALEARLDLAEQETMRRVAEERLRIAREVHDVVGHGLATIALRAGVADRVADGDPAEVREALRAIRQVSRGSLAELSALLGVLRAEGEEAAAVRAPAPDLDALATLVDRLRDAGLQVALDMAQAGDASMPEVVGAASYRIVQEALTNVARHAGPDAHAHVRLARHDGVVEVEVCDDGRGAAPGVRPGGGLTGMRERAAALGGCFEAGGAPGGGFRVWASLPVPR